MRCPRCHGCLVMQDDTAQDGARLGAGPGSIPAEHDHQQSSDAAPLSDPAEPYRVKLRVCERTPQAITHTFNAIPEELRQDVFQEYQAQLKSLGKKK